MISKRLKNIFLMSIPIFVAHGLEEYFTGFYNVDSISRFVFQYFEQMTVYQGTFLMFQIMVWLLLIGYFLLVFDNKWQRRLIVIPGIIYFFELHHIVKALILLNYYPGLITALLLPVIGFFFWKEFFTNHTSGKIEQKVTL